MKQLAIAMDQLLNALCGGWADETLSARMWRHRTLPGWRQARKIVDQLFFWQPNHCYQSWVNEKERKQLPRDYRGA
ncbi:MAG: pseudouridine synthase [Thermodesulfobacteriota bacterium]